MRNIKTKLRRESPTTLTLVNSPAPLTIFANNQVLIEGNAVKELWDMMQCTEGIRKVVITPDFHKGAGIPVGTTILADRLLPKAIGNDIGCGMRLHYLGIRASEIRSSLDVIIPKLRHMFFEGGRNIAMTPEQRGSLLRDGLVGLLDTVPQRQMEGQWASFHKFAYRDADRVEQLGSTPTKEVKGFEDFIQTVRDSQIGSIGGGNHFVELQEILWSHDPYLIAGDVALMIHSGSVAIGRAAAQRESIDSIYNATNFAFGNRLFLALMAIDALEIQEAKLVYDSPHNFVWCEGDLYLHRKGACPARVGEPVILPGSMGTTSYLLSGLGNDEALCSSAHGAGRSMGRGAASAKLDVGELADLTVVLPIDLTRVRRDIVEKKNRELLQEAPGAYKRIEPVVETLMEAGIASPVAAFKPILTMKA